MERKNTLKDFLYEDLLSNYDIRNLKNKKSDISKENEFKIYRKIRCYIQLMMIPIVFLTIYNLGS